MLQPFKQWIVLVAMLVMVHSAQAGIDVRSFENKEQQVLYDQLMYELRCLVCQNENLAASNADLAKDLRDEVYMMITKQNMDEVAVKKFLVDRYGDFVLYRPPLKKSTWFLWFGPFIMLFLGGVFVFFFVRSSRSKGREKDNDDSGISQEERDELQKLLVDNKK